MRVEPRCRRRALSRDRLASDTCRGGLVTTTVMTSAIAAVTASHWSPGWGTSTSRSRSIPKDAAASIAELGYPDHPAPRARCGRTGEKREQKGRRVLQRIHRSLPEAAAGQQFGEGGMRGYQPGVELGRLHRMDTLLQLVDNGAGKRQVGTPRARVAARRRSHTPIFEHMFDVSIALTFDGVSPALDGYPRE